MITHPNNTQLSPAGFHRMKPQGDAQRNDKASQKGAHASSKGHSMLFNDGRNRLAGCAADLAGSLTARLSPRKGVLNHHTDKSTPLFWSDNIVNALPIQVAFCSFCVLSVASRDWKKRKNQCDSVPLLTESFVPRIKLPTFGVILNPKARRILLPEQN